MAPIALTIAGSDSGGGAVASEMVQGAGVRFRWPSGPASVFVVGRRVGRPGLPLLAGAGVGAMQAQMTLNLILGPDRSPLGQILQYDARTLRSSGFRFDDAPEPNHCFRFLSAGQLTSDDVIVELRSVDEAPNPAHPDAQRISPNELKKLDPNQGKRLALCCTTGLRAWRAAEKTQPDWPGEIVLVAASTS